MGQSATASLRYGIYIGGDEEEWMLEEYSDDDYALTGTASWISEASDTDDDWQSLAEAKLLVAAGFTETYSASNEGYFERRNKVDEKVLVEIEWFGSYEYSTYALVLKKPEFHVNWGVEKIDLPHILSSAAWDTDLREACEVLGITPTETPGWLLGAHYG